MTAYLSSAVAFIRDAGDELERGRLAGILGREQPEPKVIRVLATRQNEDGGFPYQMIAGRPSAVAATAAALQWLHDLRHAASSQVERAVAYLLTVQRPDGTWEESPSLVKYDPPPLARPGHAAGRLYATALAASWLARLLGPRHESVHAAAAAVGASRQEAWPEDEPVQITILAVALVALTDGRSAPVTRSGLEALVRLPAEAWSADRLADLALSSYAAGFAADEPLLTWALRRLTAMQREDGGWSSEHGADREVDLSLRALGALLAYGISSGTA